jgi:hypothetical protein
MSRLRGRVKSTRNLAADLTRQGHRVGADTVGDLPREEGSSLQGNAKILVRLETLPSGRRPQVALGAPPKITRRCRSY